jgi:hypothetical protein
MFVVGKNTSVILRWYNIASLSFFDLYVWMMCYEVPGIFFC